MDGDASTSRYLTGRDLSSKNTGSELSNGEPTSIFNRDATSGSATPAVMICSADVT
jgi:hypothetical protein